MFDCCLTEVFDLARKRDPLSHRRPDCLPPADDLRKRFVEEVLRPRNSDSVVSLRLVLLLLLWLLLLLRALGLAVTADVGTIGELEAVQT